MAKSRMSGCDVSHHQTSIKSMLNDNDFFIVKATEGRTYTDPKFYEHISTALAAGKLIGCYHFARPENNCAADEAKHFVEIVKPYIGKAILALDWEGKAWNYNTQWALDWLEEVYSLTGVRPVIYCNYSKQHLCQAIADADFGLWHVHWGKNTGTAPAEVQPKCWKFWALWQYTSTPYDKDYFNGDEATWQKYCNSSIVIDGDTTECQCETCIQLRSIGWKL